LLRWAVCLHAVEQYIGLRPRAGAMRGAPQTTQVRVARTEVAASTGLGTTSSSSSATSWVITERLSADLAPHPHGGQTGQSQTGRSSIEQMYAVRVAVVKVSISRPRARPHGDR
jgi:hypothetical protein